MVRVTEYESSVRPCQLLGSMAGQAGVNVASAVASYLLWGHICGRQVSVHSIPTTQRRFACACLLGGPLASHQPQCDGALSCPQSARHSTCLPAMRLPQPPSPHTVIVILLFSSMLCC